MSRKAHVTFLGEGAAVTSPPYPTERITSSPPVMKTVGNGNHVRERTLVRQLAHRTNRSEVLCLKYATLFYPEAIRRPDTLFCFFRGGSLPQAGLLGSS